MFSNARKTFATVAALAAFVANAASSGSSGSSSSSSSGTAQTQQPAPPPGGPGGGPGGPHMGANGKAEEPLTGETADKVAAAAKAEVNGTVERVETDVDHGSPYEAHIRKSDGTEVEVLVNKDFKVTAVNEMRR